MSNSSVFRVKDDCGNVYEVYEIKSLIDTSNLFGASAIQGLSTFRLVKTNGALNQIDKNTFKDIRTGLILGRIP